MVFWNFEEGGGSDDEGRRYTTNTKYLGNRFTNSKNMNFTVDYQPSLDVSVYMNLFNFGL